MADRSLIEANRRMLKAGRRPEYKSQATSGNNLFDTVKQVNTDRKNKIKAINNSVSNSMGKMKSNLDLTAYSREEQKNIGKFLTNQRSIYANSANELAKISDTSSPEYQYHVDVMNNVNNSFVNLKNQLDSYKENKIEFAEGVRTGLFSEGNDEMQYNTAASMYGLTGDEKTNAPFQIAENGNLGFNINNEFVSYNDFEQPFAKDYKVASTILKQTADLYKNHTLLQGPQKDLLRLNLEASLTDPKTIKSLVSDFESQGLNFSDIPLDDMDAAKGMIVDRIMNSYTEVAAQGKAEYDAKRAEKNPGPNNNSGYNSNQQSYLNRIAVAGKNLNTTITIPNQQGRFKFDPVTKQFIRVNSAGEFVDPAGDGVFVGIALDEAAQLGGVKLEDMQTALGLN